MSNESPLPGHLIEPVYPYDPDREGFVLYAGDLEVEKRGKSHRAHGLIDLRLAPSTQLAIHFAGPAPALADLAFSGEYNVAVPAGARLDAPVGASLPERPEGAKSWVSDRLSSSCLEAGDLGKAERLLIHLGASLKRARFKTLTTLADGSRQAQIPFELPGWELILAPVPHPSGSAIEPLPEGSFGAVIEATAAAASFTPEIVERLAHDLFYLLSFLSNREVVVGPICGLRGDDIVWCQWAAGRGRPGKSFASWCPGHLVAEALPVLAKGYGDLAGDKSLALVVERAIDHLLSADSAEVLDVRVPVACSGLELLAWGVLRRQALIDQDTFTKITAAAAVRLLLHWAGVPAELPSQLSALEARRKRLSNPEYGGPEMTFNVRNGVIHPPRKIKDPEWPEGEELFESWQLATWALQLVLLRVLGYDGEYWSRLRLGRSEIDTEAVPWASA